MGSAHSRKRLIEPARGLPSWTCHRLYHGWVEIQDWVAFWVTGFWVMAFHLQVGAPACILVTLATCPGLVIWTFRSSRNIGAQKTRTGWDQAATSTSISELFRISTTRRRWRALACQRCCIREPEVWLNSGQVC